MTPSKARRLLSGLMEKFGRDGILAVPKPAPVSPERHWPPCDCGHSLCPSGQKEAAPPSRAQTLSERVAERNKWSRRGGL